MIGIKSILTFLQRKPKKGELMPVENAKSNRDEILKIAEVWAKDKGIFMLDPIEANYHYDDVDPYWLVKSNALGKGASTIIQIDDKSKQVIHYHKYPR
jgi:hypothetical protein